MEIDRHKIYRVNEFEFKNYIHLTTQEKEMVLDWRNNPKVSSLMYNTKLISFADHLGFVSGLENREDCFYWLVHKDCEPYGTINIIHVDYEQGSCEVGYLINPNLLGGGDGFGFAVARQLFLNELGVRYIYGAVKKNNYDAIIMTEYFGARKIGEKINNNEMYYEYRKDIPDIINDLSNKSMKGLVKFYRTRIKELKNGK